MHSVVVLDPSLGSIVSSFKTLMALVLLDLCVAKKATTARVVRYWYQSHVVENTIALKYRPQCEHSLSRAQL